MGKHFIIPCVSITYTPPRLGKVTQLRLSISVAGLVVERRRSAKIVRLATLYVPYGIFASQVTPKTQTCNSAITDLRH